MPRATTRRINEALPEGYVIVKGEGYYYFIGDGEYGDTFQWESSSVMIPYLNLQSVKAWIESFLFLANHADGGHYPLVKNKEVRK